MYAALTKTIPRIAIVAAAATLLIGAWTAHAEEKPSVVIKMIDMPASFEPQNITIKVGDTVEWKNVGNSVHHATSDPSEAMKPEDASTPNGAKAFDSGFLHPGDTYSHTFTEPGIYNYVCAPHETSGMKGKIVVVPKEQAAR